MTDAVERLVALVEAETATLKAGGTPDFAAAADEKSRALLAMRDWRPMPGDDRALVLLRRLSAALDANADCLRQHMQAATALADTLAEERRLADSDGTYRRWA